MVEPTENYDTTGMWGCAISVWRSGKDLEVLIQGGNPSYNTKYIAQQDQNDKRRHKILATPQKHNDLGFSFIATKLSVLHSKNNLSPPR